MGNIVAPLPSIGGMFAGRDATGRELRVSAHPEADRIVLSIWQSGHCLATVRLARADVPDVVHALTEGLAAVPPSPDLANPDLANPDLATPATVHELRPASASASGPTLATQLADLAEQATTRLATWLRRP